MVSVIGAILMAIGFSVILLCGVMVGGFLVFKSKASPGERFIGTTPKGEVFVMPDSAAEDFPEQKVDENILKRTEQFLGLIGGKKQC